MTRALLILGLMIHTATAQELDSLLAELDQPDEVRHEWEILDRLIEKGFSRDEDQGPSDNLGDSRLMLWVNGGMFRQRIQFSPSLQGWRIMNKGWIGNEYMNVTFVVEQDPGEKSNSDHAALSISTDRIRGVDNLIIGSFNIRAGSGLLFSPAFSRLSILPASLVSNLTPDARPHYSTREFDYLQGIAANWVREEIKFMAYVSHRSLVGKWQENVFLEETTGIHPASRPRVYHRRLEVGSLAVYKYNNSNFYFGSRFREVLEAELGIQFGNKQHVVQAFAVFLGSSRRLNATWSIRMQDLRMVFGLRHYADDDLSTNSQLRLIPRNRTGETAYAFRVQAKPNRIFQMYFALDGAVPKSKNTLSDLQHIQQFTLVSILRSQAKEIQLQLSNQKRHDLYPYDPWAGSRTAWGVNRISMAYSHEVKQELRYRVNLKIAASPSARSILVQQRLRWMPWSTCRLSLGYARFNVPDSRLNLTIYESGLVESYNFFSAYGDGQRWSVHAKYAPNEKADAEFQIAFTQKFGDETEALRPSLGFQLSIVL